MKQILIGIILPHGSKSKGSAGEKISCAIFIEIFGIFIYTVNIGTAMFMGYWIFYQSVMLLYRSHIP